ncbi:terminase large subunit [Pseudomonas phage BroderSalsa]|nr:terminase large subunit [Pseudomonas phage BroderSalsa]
MESTERMLSLLKEIKERQKFWRIKQYQPYGWQEKFITASSNCSQLLAMTGNRCGKTYTGAFIMACHLTGLYPDWWMGRRYDRPVEAWAAGISTDTTRDILQSELLGSWKNPEAFGTGAIPKELILETIRREGKPGCVQAVLVRHISGGSSALTFKSYEMDQDKFMGTAIDIIWLDEECPKDIYTQCVTRTATVDGIVYLTFTPEHGLTELVKDFMYDIKDGQFMISASWDDAPHLDDKVKTQLMSVYSPAERKMRVSGQPSIGSGVVFPILEDKIKIEPRPIPEHWMRTIGIDLGYDHPNAVACIAWDNETDTYYLYDEYSEKGETLGMHADAIRSRGGQSIPVIVPHDAFKHDGATSGKQYVTLYEEQGLNVVRQPFSNPPTPDGKHGGNSVEYGVNWMLTMMDQGRFKVFSTCTKFLQEMKLYHRKDGKIVDRNDDMISATRYGAIMMTRHGKPGSGSSAYHWGSSQKLVPSWHSGVV